MAAGRARFQRRTILLILGEIFHDFWERKSVVGRRSDDLFLFYSLFWLRRSRSARVRAGRDQGDGERRVTE